MRGFSLIEVLVAFIIAILSLSILFLILSFSTNILIKFDNEKVLEEITHINTLIIESNYTYKTVLSKDINFSIADLNIKECFVKIYRNTEYILCNVQGNNNYLQYKGWKIFYNPDLDILITRMD